MKSAFENKPKTRYDNLWILQTILLALFTILEFVFILGVYENNKDNYYFFVGFATLFYFLMCFNLFLHVITQKNKQKESAYGTAMMWIHDV